MRTSQKVVPACRYVVAVDGGKTYGVALWSHSVGSGWELTKCRSETGIPNWLHSLRDYDVHLLAEGTAFGGAARHIQRCVGRFEGVLGIQAAMVPVAVWRKSVFTPAEYRKCAVKRGSRKKWKDLAVAKCERLNLDVPKGPDAHHACEAALIGYGYVRGMLPAKKIHGLP